MSASDQNERSPESSNELSEWLSILSLPIGIAILVLFQDTFFDLARAIMVEFNVSLLVAFGIIAFILVFVIDALVS